MSDAEYAIYPLTMGHPHFTASKAIPVPGSQVYGPDGQITRQDYSGTPQRFPPVTVNSETEEDYYLAQGYVRAGQVDPTAWVRAHSDPPPENYKPVKYPLWRNGQLIMTAQEDPEPDEDDMVEEAPAPVAAAPAQPTQDENLRAMVEQMNQTMLKMSAQMAEQKAEADKLAVKNAELEAMLDEATKPTPAAAEERRPPGRPRRAA